MVIAAKASVTVVGILAAGTMVGVGVHSVQPQGVITEQVTVSIVLVGALVGITWRMAYKMGWSARSEKYVDEELKRLRNAQSLPKDRQ